MQTSLKQHHADVQDVAAQRRSRGVDGRLKLYGTPLTTVALTLGRQPGVSISYYWPYAIGRSLQLARQFEIAPRFDFRVKCRGRAIEPGSALLALCPRRDRNGAYGAISNYFRRCWHICRSLPLTCCYLRAGEIRLECRRTTQASAPGGRGVVHGNCCDEGISWFLSG